jgi:predicted ATPase/DNA-binding XRE family transcriptional regulator
VALREHAGLTQEELAHRAGMSVRGLSNLERGQVSRPRLRSLEALADAMRLDPTARRLLLAAYRPPDGGPRWLGPRPHLRGLIGREAETAQLRDALTQRHLVTVTGPGGCGKTALALHVASGLGVPVAVLTLASLSSTEQIPAALASVLQVGGGSTDAAMTAAATALGAVDQLLVVDNAEHLVAGVADLIARLLGGCPDLTVLVTSREPLGLSEELMLPLHPLPVPEEDGGRADTAAVELFTQRAREALPTVDLSDTAAVRRICRRLDGLPLALELAAARVRALPVPLLADRLDAGAPLLTAGAAGRTLDETVDWSYRLLSAAERTALAQLSVFRTAFTAAAAEDVLEVGDDPVAVVARLVDRSLLQVDPGDRERYVMLRTIRDYAARRLEDSGQRTATEGRHLDHWMGRARALNAITVFDARADAARAMADQLPDVEAAMAAGLEIDRGVEVVELAQLLIDCWNLVPGYPVRGEQWLGQIDRLADRSPPWLRALSRTSRGQLLTVIGDRRRSLEVLQQALDDADSLRPHQRLDLLAMVTVVELGQLDPRAMDRARQLVRPAPEVDDDIRAVAASTAAQVALYWADTTAATAALDLLDPLVESTCRWLTPTRHGMRALLAVHQGDPDRADAELTKAHGAVSPSAGPARRFELGRLASEVLLALGRPDEAYEQVTVEMNALLSEYPEMRQAFCSLRVPMAEALRLRGDLDRAAVQLRSGLAAALATRSFRIGLPGVLVTAALAASRGDRAAAAEFGAGWQHVRVRLGLPLPVAYRPAVEAVGLPVAPPAQHPRHSGEEMEDLMDRAILWCSART